MSKSMISALLIGIVAAGLMALSDPATAADLTPPSPQANRPAEANCGPCGCLRVRYVYHRELRSTYGIGFDPRNFDQTEPYYYFGPVRAYPRFADECDPVE